ncbi:NUDIX hydrolase, partial [Mesorhizobium sp. M4B.F.Ca.ET.172.01.1.1]
MNETDLLKDYDPSAFQRPSVAVDLVLLGIRAGRPTVLLVKRDQLPHAGRWALP